ncbi:hypothetical protein [Limnohabitans sp. TEGF004]|jgi:hypothetical protein|uniref:hypothetical protein n=1 Tax=Limnohabitans sp. TEGF004 TaxID=2986281 RepID=UPI002377CB22|nr:hypothetical protein [Limnohabitans sp. TEGF004]BDU54938.1 hypothetical protein LTEGF4_06190 [Limnohabitans sp. TEGF004]
MAFPSSFRATMAALALACTTGVGNAHATDNGLYDWQPCPNSLAVEGGAQPAKKWDLTLSPYTHHWNYNPEHRPVKLVAMDSHVSGGRFCGLALFTNSFGQESAYLYVGQQWDGIFGNPKLFTKLSAGLLWGYRGEYRDKIPFNHLGIAPAVIPSLGYYITPKDSAQVYVLGNAGLLFAYTRSF